MASILRVNTLTDASSNNSTAMSTINQGTAKAWGNLNGSGTIAIKDSNNISSITDSGVGQYVFIYTSNMANDDYAHTCNGSEQVFSPLNALNTLAGSVRVYSKNLSDSHIDAQEVSVQITGDLA